MNEMNNSTTELAELNAKIDDLTKLVRVLGERTNRQAELLSELTPIASEAMKAASGHLSSLEERGYFTFASESARVFDRIVTAYSAEDVAQLGDNIVGILDTVRLVTQPDVLAIARDATAAMAHSDEVEPKGVLGMLRETRDDDVRRGVAMMLEVLRHVGRGSQRIADGSGSVTARPEAPETDAQKKLQRLLGPRRDAATTAAPARVPRAPVATQRASAAPAAAPAAAPSSGAISCVFVPEGVWSRDWATEKAASVGVPLLTEAHWTVIEFARNEFIETKNSPNIRRIAKASGVDTRTIYGLWPSRPGVMTAYVAGIPKPGGCI